LIETSEHPVEHKSNSKGSYIVSYFDEDEDDNDDDDDDDKDDDHDHDHVVKAEMIPVIKGQLGSSQECLGNMRCDPKLG